MADRLSLESFRPVGCTADARVGRPSRRPPGGAFRPLLMPAEAEADPAPEPPCAKAQAEAAAAAAKAEAERRRAEALERIADTLAECHAHHAAFRRRWAEAAAAALGHTLAGLLPPLAARGFPARAAAAIASVIDAAETAAPFELALAEEDAAEIEAALRAHRSASAATLRRDPAIRPGEVRLTWSGGAFEFSADALAAALAREVERALAALVTETEESEA